MLLLLSLGWVMLIKSNGVKKGKHRRWWTWINKYHNDYIDRFISYYPMTFRTKRWPTTVILHLFAQSLSNVWIEYRERELKKGMKRNRILDLLAFQEEIGQSWCKAELSPACFRGRPSFQSFLNYCPIPAKKMLQAVLPVADVRPDGFDYWPEVTQIRYDQRCRLEHCDKIGQVRCKISLFDRWLKLFQWISQHNTWKLWGYFISIYSEAL